MAFAPSVKHGGKCVRQPFPPPVSPTELEWLYHDLGLRMAQIADGFGVTRPTVRRWLIQGGIALRLGSRRPEKPQVEPSAETETWRAIPEFWGYEASNLGRIRSWRNTNGKGATLANPRVLSPHVGPKGHLQVAVIDRDGRPHSKSVHHLVLFAFGIERSPGLECRHLDGDPSNNRPENLRWGTSDENTADKMDHGTLILGKRSKPVELAPRFGDSFIPIEAIVHFESWTAINGHPGYEVSNWGRVRSFWGLGASRKLLATSRIRKIAYTNGQPFMVFRGNKPRRLCRIVLETFSGPAPEGLECRHLDGNPHNNHISNLRWSDHTTNVRDKHLHGTLLRGTELPHAKLTEKQAKEIRERRLNGESGASLAREFDVSTSTISAIHRGYIWSHV